MLQMRLWGSQDVIGGDGEAGCNRWHFGRIREAYLCAMGKCWLESLFRAVLVL